ncbi:Gfo/Idh/MocA family oxidoreductase [Actinotalea sp. M2MS4P-6]|uniref:Gfo/Idh/MocA family protein n=1 Tax=Actinotalea sp. M2MS4P-6 TaxID=2983762 RepID=UPI0021E4EC58|nr:Gfo/Idh/MocA family oxidoreductase [Actinotalea sp. M2MS4P-6]MCV2394412.1 Gfo/Idh/MocA family oxidoreductase [Actinotalea sp. M2MS4P-6]
MTTRVVLVGAGAIAASHLAAVAESGRAEVTWVVDVDEARAADVAARHGVRRSGGSLAAALAGGADLVVLGTPPGTHLPLATEALEAGVPVLTEKPPALSLAEMDRLIAVQDRTGARVGVVFQHRFGGAGLRAAELLAPRGDGSPGPLGRPLVATCDTLWFRAPAYFEVPWRGRWEVEGGGPTMGHGIHQFDLLLALLGPWSAVRAMAARLSRDTDTEDVSAAVVQFESGAVATIVNSVLSPREVSSIRVDTDRATLELEHLYGYDDAGWRLTPAPGYADLAAVFPGAPGRPSSHAAQWAAVLDALVSGAPLPVPVEVARVTLELAAATYASAFTGREVRRGEIGAGDPFYERMQGPGAPWPPVKAPR